MEVRDRNPEMVLAGNLVSIDPQIDEDKVILPLPLYDKLTPDEWRPLIASRLNYHRNFTRKKMLVAFSYQVFTFLTLPLFLAVISILGLDPLTRGFAAGIILLWLIGMIPVASVVYAPFFNRLQQTADKQTLELLVKPTLEDVLTKIETMSPQGSKTSKGIEKRLRSFHAST